MYKNNTLKHTVSDPKVNGKICVHLMMLNKQSGIDRESRNDEVKFIKSILLSVWSLYL